MSDRNELHDALLQLAGRIPDDVLAQARLRLADGQTDGIATLRPSLDIPYAFTPAPPGPNTEGSAPPPLLDLVGRRPGDEVDEAAQAAVEQMPGAVALWRVWRTAPAWAATAIPPTRLYIVEAAETFPPLATAAVMRALIAAGLDGPLVETYQPGDELPALTRRARSAGALLWTRAEAPPIRIARVFDVVDGDGARFDSAHERIDGPDRTRMVAYLEAGASILATTATRTDVVEPQRGNVVPMSYRTDGRWLWTESVTYYLRVHGLAPEPGLLAAIRAAGSLFPAPDPADEHRALAALLQSQATTTVRTA